MFTPRPPIRPPADASPDLRTWAHRVIETLDASSRAVSFDDVGGGLPTQGTQPWMFIYGQIISSGGSGSGTGAGFVDSNGFLAYLFQETLEDFPWMGIEKPGGIKSNRDASTGSGSNFAYPLNGEVIQAGTNVLLKQVKNHWIIVGGGSGTAGSFIFTCNGDGSGGTITPKTG